MPEDTKERGGPHRPAGRARNIRRTRTKSTPPGRRRGGSGARRRGGVRETPIPVSKCRTRLRRRREGWPQAIDTAQETCAEHPGWTGRRASGQRRSTGHCGHRNRGFDSPGAGKPEYGARIRDRRAPSGRRRPARAPARRPREEPRIAPEALRHLRHCVTSLWNQRVGCDATNRGCVTGEAVRVGAADHGRGFGFGRHTCQAAITPPRATAGALPVLALFCSHDLMH